MIEWVILLAILVALYMAWNIGANDVANAMGTSVGSKALTMKQAVLVAAVLEFAGAVLVGTKVSNSHRKDVIDPGMFANDPTFFMYGMLAALLGAAVWITVATYFSLPVSTTHSIIGAIIGFGLIQYGPEVLVWKGLTKIMASWVISPLLGAVLAYLLFGLIRQQVLRQEDPPAAARRFAPPMVGLVMAIITVSIFYKGLKNVAFIVAMQKSAMVLGHDSHLPLPLLIAVAVGLLAFLVALMLLRRARTDDLDQAGVERLFAYLQIMSAAYVAFAHGANDVGNAVGPLASVVDTFDHSAVDINPVSVPLWILIVGGIGIVIGLVTWGYKVIETVGSKITDITPTRGFAAEFGTATTVLIFSKIGLPISTTHTLVGAVIGVGLAGGAQAVDLRVVRNIVASWVMTLPAAGFVTILIYLLFKVTVI